MSESWYSLSDYKNNTSNIISASARVSAESPWFSGHFPSEPILPGIAELSIIFDLIKQYNQENGKRIKVSSIKRVRFKLPIRPEESLEIAISPENKKENSYSFKIISKGKTACMGIIVTEMVD